MLLAPVVARLRLVGAAATLVWAAYLAVAALQGFVTREIATIVAIALSVSIVLVALTFVKTLSAKRLRAVGTAYSIAIAFTIAAADFSTSTSPPVQGHAAWSVVWITLFPVLVPGSPRRILIETFVAASMSPFAYGLALGTQHVLQGSATWLSFAPIYLAAVFAYAASRILSGLGAQVAAATELGMYELESRIAQGGMGEVWRARHRLLSRPAAVKLIRPRESEGRSQFDAVAQQRFEREAQVTASLKSPHTVSLYDFGVTDGGMFYYVMELLEGDDLEQLVTREGPLAPARVVHILEQTLDSLAEAHQEGLVHRDIKPANLHISHRGLDRNFVKVLDFGLVTRSKHDPSDRSLTLVNTIMGTPAYLAPEMITGEAPVDARADLYSLGCVAYYLLTGQCVFEADSPMGMAIAQVTAKPVAPSRRTRQAIPLQLERLVLACLEKSPERRPQSAVQMLEMLRAIHLADEMLESGERVDIFAAAELRSGAAN